MTDQATVTLQGDTLHLTSQPVGEGEQLPDFRLVDDLPESIHFEEDKANAVHLITSAVSVDTPVCANQFQTFDQRAAELDDDGVEVWYVSRDLPFAMQRFADEHDLDNLRFLSDYKDEEFGEHTGLAIEETGLLARATFVVDRDGEIVYSEVLDEIAEEPDYEAAIEAARKAAQG